MEKIWFVVLFLITLLVVTYLTGSAAFLFFFLLFGGLITEMILTRLFQGRFYNPATPKEQREYLIVYSIIIIIILFIFTFLIMYNTLY